jgi:hypothetical protein
MMHPLQCPAIRYHADINESCSSASREPQKDRFVPLSLFQGNRRFYFAPILLMCLV